MINHIRINGFTLVEVLVAVVILAVGLLGLASLQSLALKDNQDAYLRSQANFLAYEMNDRLRANAAYWRGLNDTQIATVITGAKADTAASHPYCSISDPPSPAGTLGCTAAQQAQYDVYRWWQDASAVLPGAGIAITWDDDAMTSATPGNEVIDLTLTWSRSNQAVNMARNNDGVSIATLEMDVRL